MKGGLTNVLTSCHREVWYLQKTNHVTDKELMIEVLAIAYWGALSKLQAVGPRMTFEVGSHVVTF
jgi:hypothetical protein